MRRGILAAAAVVAWGVAGTAVAQQLDINSQQPPLGTGSYSLQQPMVGSYSLQQPLGGSNLLPQSPVNSYVFQPPSTGTISIPSSDQDPTRQAYSQ